MQSTALVDSFSERSGVSRASIFLGARLSSFAAGAAKLEPWQVELCLKAEVRCLSRIRSIEEMVDSRTWRSSEVDGVCFRKVDRHLGTELFRLGYRGGSLGDPLNAEIAVQVTLGGLGDYGRFIVATVRRWARIAIFFQVAKPSAKSGLVQETNGQE